LKEELDLDIQMHKCVAYCPGGKEYITNECHQRQFKMDDGIEIAGGFIGKVDWIDEKLSNCIQEMKDGAFRKILLLKLQGKKIGVKQSTQQAMYLLRQCVAPSIITHLLRTVPPSIMKPHARTFDKMVFEACRLILGENSDKTLIETTRGKFIAQLTQLSPKSGGFGLTSAEHLSPIAYSASFLLVGETISRVLNFTDISTNETKLCFPELDEILKGGILKETKEFANITTEDIFESKASKAQKLIAQSFQQQLLNKVLNQADVTSKAQILSQGGEGGQIMHAIPTIRDQQLDDDIAVPIFRFRALMDQEEMDPDKHFICPLHENQQSAIIDSTCQHSLICNRQGKGNLKALRNSCHFRASLILAQHLKSVAAKGILKSTILREKAVRESIGWNPRQANPGTESRSDICVTTNGVDDHWDLVITRPNVHSHHYAGCATKAGVAASKAFNDKINHYNRLYTVPENSLHPIAIEIHGRWHPKSRRTIKNFMKVELTNGNTLDSENLSWHMDRLFKAITVSLAKERARAIFKLQENLKAFPHEELLEVLTQDQDE